MDWFGLAQSASRGCGRQSHCSSSRRGALLPELSNAGDIFAEGALGPGALALYRSMLKLPATGEPSAWEENECFLKSIAQR
jgi:hypothetical protein